MSTASTIALQALSRGSIPRGSTMIDLDWAPQIVDEIDHCWVCDSKRLVFGPRPKDNKIFDEIEHQSVMCLECGMFYVRNIDVSEG